VLEPALARHIRDRKVDTIGRALRRSGAAVVASANPGCAAHLAEAGLTVMHPIDLLEEAYR
jgi:glycolate oxidase iron-sulfur subunit